MKRKIKNIILIVILVLGITGIYLSGMPSGNNMGTPPDMNNSDSSDSNKSSGNPPSGEKPSGKPVKAETENLIHNIWFFILLALIIYVTINDIIKLF